MKTNIKYEIKTERLFLRPYQEEDVSAVFMVLSAHPEITKWMLFDPPRKIGDTREFFKQSQKNFPKKGVVFSIFEDDKFAGIVGLEFEMKKYNTNINLARIGYWLDPAFHGRGIMTEAASAVIDFAFLKLGIHKVETGHFAKNEASRRVIEKCGFRKIGVREKHFFRHGKWEDHVEYERIVSDD